MKIETKRLEIIALTSEQLALLIHDSNQLEKELSCFYQAEPIEGIFREILEGQLEITRKDAGHYMWHSFWLLLRKTDRTVVGSADFKALPNDKGEVEIGYGLGKAFEHHGYMTEAVAAMCRWALSQDCVTHVIAETETDNIPSQNILIRCGFSEYLRHETIWWKL